MYPQSHKTTLQILGELNLIRPPLLQTKPLGISLPFPFMTWLTTSIPVDHSNNLPCLPFLKLGSKNIALHHSVSTRCIVALVFSQSSSGRNKPYPHAMTK